MYASTHILKAVGSTQLLLTVVIGGKTMSKTIRNQKTKGFLDKLALQQRTRKLIRAVKNEDMWVDFDEQFIPTAEV